MSEVLEKRIAGLNGDIVQVDAIIAISENMDAFIVERFKGFDDDKSELHGDGVDFLDYFKEDGLTFEPGAYYASCFVFDKCEEEELVLIWLLHQKIA